MKKRISIFTLSLLILLSAFAVLFGGAAAQTEERVSSYGALFEASEGMTVSDNFTSPSYSNISPKQGVAFTATQEGASVRYKNKIDLSSNKKSDVFAEILVLPETAGTEDFYELVITLEDVYDPSNYLHISIYRGTYDELISMVKAQAPGQVLAGYNASTKTMQSETDRGTPVYSSFKGKGVAGLTGTITLHYDAAGKALYANPGVYADLENSDLVTKFSDPKYVNKEWDGFTTGEVYVSFSVSSLKRTQGSFLLLSLNGQSLAGEISDSKPPVLLVDMGKNTEVPEGQAGIAYPVFPVTVFDELDGEMSAADVTVYSGSVGGTVVAEGDSSSVTQFMPQETGTYYLCYSASDAAGLTAEKVFEISVREDLGALTYILDGEIAENSTVGSVIRIPAGRAENGSGVKDVDISVTIAGRDGEVEVIENTFSLNEQGVYYVTFTVTDYLRQQYVSEYKINVTASATPVITEPVTPRFLISGKPTEFSAFTAIDYDSLPGCPTETQRKKICIYTADGELLEELDYDDRVYTPDIKNGEELIVEYSAACIYDHTKVSSVRKSVRVLELDTLSGYFYDENGDTEAEASDTYVLYKTQTEGARLEFVNSLMTDAFSFSFNVPKQYNAFSAVDVWLQDSYDPDTEVKFTIYKNKEDPSALFSNMYVNDRDEKVEILGSFYDTTNNYFLISLNGRSVIDASNNTIINLTETLAGEPFEGFRSGKVYLSFSFRGVEGEAGVAVSRVLNQVMSNIDGDYIRPVIVVSDEILRERSFGEEICIPSAKAADVLDQYVELTVSLIDVHGGYLIDHAKIDEDLYFTARSYGTYTIEYRASDSSGNPISLTYAISILDETVPEMELNGEMPSEGKAGERILFPSAIVTDNVSPNLSAYVFVIDGSGKMTAVEGYSYTFEKPGRYTVRYYCKDAEDNFVMRDFEILIK